MRYRPRLGYPGPLWKRPLVGAGSQTATIPAAGLVWAGRASDALVSGSDVTSWPGMSGKGTATIVGTPTRTGGSIFFGAGNYFLLPTPAVLTGDFTAYGVIDARAAGQVYVLFANTTGNGVVVVNSDDKGYVVDDAGSLTATPAALATGAALVRFRRASGQCYARITGSAEVTMAAGGAGTVTLDDIGFWSQFGGIPTNAAVGVKFEGLYSADTVTNGTDAAIVAWINTQYGVTW